MIFDEREIFAFWLYCHPYVKARIYKNGKHTYFWFDRRYGFFLCQTPENKVRNGVYRARGLDVWLTRYNRRTTPPEPEILWDTFNVSVVNGEVLF